MCTLLLELHLQQTKMKVGGVLQIRKQLFGKYELTASHSVESEDCGISCGECSRQSVRNMVPATKPVVGFLVYSVYDFFIKIVELSWVL